MKQLALVLLAGSILIFSSCGKTGPQGPQGNANVIGSDPFSVSSWSFNSGENAYMASFNLSDITQAVADRGVVQIFLWYPSDGTWRNLPDVYNGTQFYFRYSKGGFDIYYGTLDGSTPAFPGTFTFRSVVIAPAFKEAHPNVNWNSYEDITRALNEAKIGATAN